MASFVSVTKGSFQLFLSLSATRSFQMEKRTALGSKQVEKKSPMPLLASSLMMSPDNIRYITSRDGLRRCLPLFQTKLVDKKSKNFNISSRVSYYMNMVLNDL